ncbi:MAG: hypothetical protein ABEJ31_04475 [Haloarculaceae archaeon]
MDRRAYLAACAGGLATLAGCTSASRPAGPRGTTPGDGSLTATPTDADTATATEAETSTTTAPPAADPPPDLRVKNRTDRERDVQLRVWRTAEPACRSVTPACGMPARVVTALDRTIRLDAGCAVTFVDAVAHATTYRLSADAGELGRAEVAWSVGRDDPAERAVTLSTAGVTISGGG